MEDIIIISNLNDFIFCPASIYFHKLYGGADRLTYQSSYQINGTKAHESVDKNTYSTRKNVVTSLEVYSEKYRITGKIDIYDADKKLLVERKKHINKIYDGYVFQMYGQFYALIEMGYPVEHLEMRSIDDNKKYKIGLPENNLEMKEKFEKVIVAMRTFDLEQFYQTNVEKCKNCIYENACDRSLIQEGELC